MIRLARIVRVFGSCLCVSVVASGLGGPFLLPPTSCLLTRSEGGQSHAAPEGWVRTLCGVQDHSIPHLEQVSQAPGGSEGARGGTTSLPYPETSPEVCLYWRRWTLGAGRDLDNYVYPISSRGMRREILGLTSPPWHRGKGKPSSPSSISGWRGASERARGKGGAR